VRVDGASAPLTAELDPRARLKRYLSAFRRRWYLVLLPVLVGAALGWVTAPSSSVEVNDLGVPVPSTTYHKASHVLIEESRADPTGATMGVNLSQAAYLVNTGEVPARVAEELGLDVDEVEDSLIGLPRAEVSSIEVQAIGTDAEDTVALADSAAAHLLVVLQTQAEVDAAEARDEVVARIEELDQQLSDLNRQIAADPPDRTQLEAQQRSASNQYSLVYEQLQALAAQPPPSAGLTTLEGAKAEEISEAEFDDIEDTIQEGAAYVTGAAATTTEARSDSDEESEGVGAPTRAALGGIVGLGLGAGLVLLLDRFDGRLRRREDVETVTGLTVVAEIPPLNRKQQRSLEVVTVAQPRSRSAEAYRVVRGAVLFGLGDERPADGGAIVLMVTSANPGEGKTTTAANLAAVLAEGGFSVLVVNCDFRRPQVHRYLLETPEEVREVDGGFDATVRPRATRIPGVRLVTGLGEFDDEVNPLEIVALQRKVVERARSHVDVIVLDTAPFLATNDASELLQLTDQVLVVVRSGKTTAEAAHRTSEILERFDAPTLGVVFNDSDESHAAQYYYGYGESGSRSRERSRPDDRSESASPEPPADPPGPAAIDLDEVPEPAARWSER
jgi:Mrp family chromosome partitioning ATPase